MFSVTLLRGWVGHGGAVDGDGTAATEAEAAGRQRRRRRLADGGEGVKQEGVGRGCDWFLAIRQVEPKHEKGLG